MDFLLAICQAIGLALAVGIGGPLAAMFIAAMAKVHAGIDPRGTDWDFLGSSGFLAAILAVNVVAFYFARQGRPRGLPHVIFAALFGAIAGAASLAEEGESAAVGLIIGLLVGGAAAMLAGEVLNGAQQRAARPQPGADGAGATGTTLEAMFAGAGIVLALLALFLPPLSLIGVGALAVLYAGRRRRASEKYEGLRVLR